MENLLQSAKIWYSDQQNINISQKTDDINPSFLNPDWQRARTKVNSKGQTVIGVPLTGSGLGWARNNTRVSATTRGGSIYLSINKQCQ